MRMVGCVRWGFVDIGLRLKKYCGEVEVLALIDSGYELVEPACL